MGQEVFKQILRGKGLKATQQRVLVLETMASHPNEHLSAEDIYELVKKKYPEIGLSTIYRTVLLLVEMNLIDKVILDDGYARYELNGIDGDTGHHHHHAICSRCKKVFSIEDDLLENLEQELYDTMEFVVTDHEVKLYGYCKNCKKYERKTNGGVLFEKR